MPIAEQRRDSYELGLTLRQNGDCDGASTHSSGRSRSDPEMREGYYGLGMALKQQARLLRKARRRRPEQSGGRRTSRVARRHDGTR